jgi:hypothetical protein
MENPAWPGLLPRREVSGFLPHTCEINYCAHGGQFKKKTQLWSGPTPFSLTRYKFKARLCQGAEKCPITVWVPSMDPEEEGKWKHPKWEGTTLEERQAIPYQVSRAVGGAIGTYMNSVGKW